MRHIPLNTDTGTWTTAHLFHERNMAVVRVRETLNNTGEYVSSVRAVYARLSVITKKARSLIRPRKPNLIGNKFHRL